MWEVLRAYGFKQELINIIKLLYVESTVQINVNGVLTDSFAIKRGVKQGCPLSAALYILAINPLLSKIKNDKRLSGINTSGGERVVVLAYADDITIIIKNGKELNIVNEHLSLYEEISGSKLNHDKTEGVWFGRSEAKPIIDIKDKDTMSILGIKFSRNDCYGENWNEKDKEIKEELDTQLVSNLQTVILKIKSSWPKFSSKTTWSTSLAA